MNNNSDNHKNSTTDVILHNNVENLADICYEVIKNVIEENNEKLGRILDNIPGLSVIKSAYFISKNVQVFLWERKMQQFIKGIDEGCIDQDIYNSYKDDLKNNFEKAIKFIDFMSRNIEEHNEEYQSHILGKIFSSYIAQEINKPELYTLASICKQIYESDEDFLRNIYNGGKIEIDDKIEDYQINRLESIGIISDKRKIGIGFEETDDNNITIGKKDNTVEITSMGKLFYKYAYCER